MMIRRKAYSYTRRDGTRVHVPAHMIRDRGAPGKGFRGPGAGIGRLRKGLLGRYGYSDVKHMSVDERHRALRRAVESLGRLHVERSLIAASTYSKRTAPRSSHIFRTNERFVKRM